MPDIDTTVIAVGATVLASAVMFYVRVYAMVIRPAMEAQKVAAAQMAEVLSNLQNLNAEVRKLRGRQDEACSRLGKLEVHVERNRETLKKINGFAR